jgi:hypothetical protein
MLRAEGTGETPRTGLSSHPAAGRRSAGSTCWPILMPVGAVALMTGAPSAAYAQCSTSFDTAMATFSTHHSTLRCRAVKSFRLVSANPAANQ